MAALPREGELLALDGMPIKAGGCAANVAIDLAKQGERVEVMGCVGRDSSAEVLLGCLERHGVGCEHLTRVAEYPTSKTVILLVEGQDRRYLHVFGANRAFTASHIKRAWLETLEVFYLGGLYILPAVKTGELLELLKFCRARRIVTVVDVVMPQTWAGFEELKLLLPEIDYFLPNNDEAKLITGCAEPIDQLRALLAAGANTVVVTQGKAGAMAARGGTYWQCDVYPASVVDPSGSGDAFSAGIITGIRRGWDLPQILRYGSALGASATRAVGTTDGVFTASEAEAFVAAHPLPVVTGTL
jgi:sugar/nucleoside kinase (ribokinase family)